MKKLITSKEEALEKVKELGLFLQYASEELKDNKEIALIAIKQNGLFLYEIKEVLENKFERFNNEYKLLKMYEREDELKNQLWEKETNISRIKKRYRI